MWPIHDRLIIMCGSVTPNSNIRKSQPRLSHSSPIDTLFRMDSRSKSVVRPAPDLPSLWDPDPTSPAFF